MSSDSEQVGRKEGDITTDEAYELRESLALLAIVEMGTKDVAEGRVVSVEEAFRSIGFNYRFGHRKDVDS